MYGLRTIVPTIIGLSPITKLRFFILDLIGATLWSTIFVLLGYYFGGTVTNLFKNIHDRLNISWPLLILIAILVIGVCMGVYLFVKNKVLEKNKPNAKPKTEGS